MTPDPNPDPESAPAPPEPAARGPSSLGRSALGWTRRALRDGTQQIVAWQLRLPEGASRVRQFVHGLWLPVVVARAVVAEPRVRRRWLRYGAVQAAATLALGGLVLSTCGRGAAVVEDGAVIAASQEAVQELRLRVEARAGELERRGPAAEQALVASERELVEDGLDEVAAKLEQRGKRGPLMPDELSIQLARALDDAALEQEAARRDRISGAVERIDGEKLKQEMARLAREGLAGMERGAGKGLPETGAGAELARRARELLDQLEPGARPETSAPLEEATGIDPRRMEEEIRQRAQARQAQRAQQGPPDERDRVAELLETVAGPAPAAALSPERAARSREVRAELKRAALEGRPGAEAKIESARPWMSRLSALGGPWRFLAWLVAVWGTFYGAQLVVIAFFRDHHSELSREACLLAGITPEDPPLDPQARLDWDWLGKRVRRFLRGWWVIATGFPICWLLGLAVPGDSLRNALFFAWMAYWYVVFAAAKSARAWVDEGVAAPPWFIRAWRRLVASFPPIRLLGAGTYGDTWERATRGLHAPAECVEQQPAAFTGLMLFRLAGSAPVVKCFVRPLVPVASALLLEAYREHHPARAATAVLQATPVPVAAAAPAPVTAGPT